MRPLRETISGVISFEAQIQAVKKSHEPPSRQLYWCFRVPLKALIKGQAASAADLRVLPGK